MLGWEKKEGIWSYDFVSKTSILSLALFTSPYSDQQSHYFTENFFFPTSYLIAIFIKPIQADTHKMNY